MQIKSFRNQCRLNRLGTRIAQSVFSGNQAENEVDDGMNAAMECCMPTVHFGPERVWQSRRSDE